eukprot:8705946-Ditylum_brightwellii.AAC.1
MESEYYSNSHGGSRSNNPRSTFASFLSAGNLGMCGSLADTLDDTSRHGRSSHRRSSSHGMTGRSLQGELLDGANRLCSAGPANTPRPDSPGPSGFYGPEDDFDTDAGDSKGGGN